MVIIVRFIIMNSKWQFD